MTVLPQSSGCAIPTERNAMVLNVRSMDRFHSMGMFLLNHSRAWVSVMLSSYVMSMSVRSPVMDILRRFTERPNVECIILLMVVV